MRKHVPLSFQTKKTKNEKSTECGYACRVHVVCDSSFFSWNSPPVRFMEDKILGKKIRRWMLRGLVIQSWEYRSKAIKACGLALLAREWAPEVFWKGGVVNTIRRFPLEGESPSKIKSPGLSLSSSVVHNIALVVVLVSMYIGLGLVRCWHVVFNDMHTIKYEPWLDLWWMWILSWSISRRCPKQGNFLSASEDYVYASKSIDASPVLTAGVFCFLTSFTI